MNGKHPIDELFSGALRDAGTMPPPSVWEGIARDRDRVRAARAARTRSLRNRGLAAVLLLLLGGATYWIFSPANGPVMEVADKQATPAPKATPEQQAPAPPSSQTTTAEVTLEESAGPAQTRPEASAATRNVSARPKQSAGADDENKSPADRQSDHQGPDEAAGKVRAADKTGGKAAVGVSAGSMAGASSNGGVVDPGNRSTAEGTKAGTPDQTRSIEPDPTEGARSSADFHLPYMAGRVSPFAANVASMPGPLLQGDSTPVYVISKGQWWFALQAEASMLSGEWKGTGPEVSELNASETWRDGRGLSFVAGREWLNGWSIGLGAGVTKQQSRFLRREVEPGHSETVTDTTWVGTAMGAQTNYTWDIVETSVDEPGTEHDYSATNTYTRLRFAPEVAYRLLEKRRLSLHARASVALSVDLGREGNTVVPATATDPLDVTTSSTATLPLSDPSLDERFPLAFALCGSVELRYRLCERWSMSALPTFTYHVPRAEGSVPALSMTELGAAVRLRYELRHQERRVK